MTFVLDQVDVFSVILSMIICVICLLAFRENRSRMPLYTGIGFAIFGFSYFLALFDTSLEMNYLVLLIRMFAFVTVFFAIYTNLGEVRTQITLLSEKNVRLEGEITERTNAELSLRNSETHLNAVIVGSPIPQFVIDRNHRVLHWNNAISEYSGIRSEDIIGTDRHWKAFYPEKRPCLADLLIDGVIEKIPAWDAGKLSPSALVEGAYEATDFFPLMGKKGTWLHFTAAPIRDESGSVIGAVETLEDITERRVAELALRNSEAQLNAVISDSPIPQFVIDKDHKVIYWNDALQEYSGIRAETIIGTNQQWKAFSYHERQSMADLLLDGTIESSPSWKNGMWERSKLIKGAVVSKVPSRKKGESESWLHFTAAPIRDSSGTIVGAIETLEDITEQKKAENALVESETKYRTLFDKTKDPVLIIENNKFVDCNSATLQVLGYPTKDELFQTHPSKLSPPTQPDGRNSFEKAEEMITIALRDGSNRFEWVHRRANGEDFWVEVSLTAIPIQDHQIIHTAWRDITDRKKAEEEIRRSLEEKEILLKEIHHRVKNNLQVVWGLIDLQIQTLKDPNTINTLRDSQNRIHTMSLIHETLYKSRDLSHIEISQYLQSLVNTLLSTYSVSPEKISVHFTLDNILLDVESAIPCGLIVNELMSNTFKHAFPGDRNGEIHIGFSLKGTTYTLSFGDTGVGIPPGVDYTNTESLGLKLVNVLATDQLDGTIQLVRDNGTTFIISFPQRIPPPAE